MRRMLATATTGAVTAMVLGGAVIGGAVKEGPTGAAASNGRQLAGTWAVEVDPDGDRVPSFTSTIVYGDEGSVVETTMNRPPAAISTGLGTWERLGDGQFAVTFRKYRWSPTGAYAGTTVVHEVSELSADGTRYTSRATTTFLDPAGRPDPALPTMQSSVTAERL